MTDKESDFNIRSKILHDAKKELAKHKAYVLRCEEYLIESLKNEADKENVGYIKTWRSERYKVKLTQTEKCAITKKDEDYFAKNCTTSPLRQTVSLDKRAYSLLPKEHQILKGVKSKIGIEVELIEDK